MRTLFCPDCLHPIDEWDLNCRHCNAAVPDVKTPAERWRRRLEALACDGRDVAALIVAAPAVLPHLQPARARVGETGIEHAHAVVKTVVEVVEVIMKVIEFVGEGLEA